MKTYKVLSLLFLLLITLSCNVVKMLKQDDGKIPDDFFNKGGNAPGDQIIFFTCSGNPCYYDTTSNSTTIITNSITNGSTGFDYYVYNGVVFISNSVGQTIHSYDLKSGNLVQIESSSGFDGIQEYQGKIYYNAGGNLKVLDPEELATAPTTLLDSANVGWLKRVYDYTSNSDKLYTCSLGGSLVHEVIPVYDGSGNPTSATLSLPSILDINNNNVNHACDSSSLFMTGETLQLVHADSGGMIYHLDLEQSPHVSSSWSGGGSVVTDLGQTWDGYFFYAAGSAVSSPDTNLYIYDVFTDTSGTILISSFTPSHLIKPIESPESFFIVANDSNLVDQIFEVDKSTYTTNMMSNFTTNEDIMHLGVGPEGFLIFRSTGVWEASFQSGAMTQKSSVPVGFGKFYGFHYNDVYNLWDSCSTCNP